MLRVNHHLRLDIVSSQLRHLHAQPLGALGRLHPVAVRAQQLPVPHLVLAVIAQRQDVVHLEAQVVWQMDAAARADAALDGVETDPCLIGNLTPLIACRPASRRPLLVDLHRFQVLPRQQRHVHRPVGLTVKVAATAHSGDQLWHRLAVGLRGAAGQVA